jgi:DNA-binding transcriptional MerR regulator/methylmalonyl-CoA mutase cobalamin-binding subunit
MGFTVQAIGVVARQTGIEISTLRKWESRYGFPRPVRTESGRRGYASDEVAMLHEVARRVAAGSRVSNVIREVFAGTAAALSDTDTVRATPALARDVEAALNLLLGQDQSRLKLMLDQARRETSLLNFVEQFAAPLTQAVGLSWAEGRMPVYSEHVFSALLETLLVREAEQFESVKQPPKVLLATLAGEKHTLGLCMAYAVLSEAGIPCLRLSRGLPVAEIAAAAAAYQVSAVGLSASVHFSPRLLGQQIGALRAALPADIGLWLGGGGMHRVSRIPAGTYAFSSWRNWLASAHAIVFNANQSYLETA